MYCFNDNNSTRSRQKGFSLFEAIVAVGVLAVIVTAIMTVTNRCISATIDSRAKMAAFELARENMETLLAKNTIEEFVEFGTSDINPDLEWENTVESFYEPITNRMWIQAACSASYTDSNNERQEVELTHWITDLSTTDIKKIQDQLNKEQEMLDEGNPYGNDPDGLLQYANSLAERGNYSAANKVLNTLQEEYPNTPQAKQGQTLQTENDDLGGSSPADDTYEKPKNVFDDYTFEQLLNMTPAEREAVLSRY